LNKQRLFFINVIFNFLTLGDVPDDATILFQGIVAMQLFLFGSGPRPFRTGSTDRLAVGLVLIFAFSDLVVGFLTDWGTNQELQHSPSPLFRVVFKGQN
jgi:hypothetical protein